MFPNSNYFLKIIAVTNTPSHSTQHGIYFIFKRRPFFDTGKKENKLVPH